MILYGVCNHSIPQFLEWKRKRMRFHVSGSPLRSYEMRGYLTAFTDVREVLRNLTYLNKMQDISCILFTGPIKLASLNGAYALDLLEEHTHPYYGIRLCDWQPSIWDSARPRAVELKAIDYTATVIAHVESTSILTDFMTIIYTLPSSTHQKPVKTVILHWIYENGSERTLSILLTKISDALTLSAKASDRLRALLTSDICERVKQAFLLVKAGTPVAEAATKMGVSAYDMRYILSIVKEGTYGDFEASCIKLVKRK